MASGKPPKDEFFVVRLWSEESHLTAQWRASITHVGSLETRLFAGYGNLCEVLERWTPGSSERGG